MSGNRNINTGAGNYNERIEGDYIQGKSIKIGENIGSPIVGGSISGNASNNTEELSGNINESDLKTLAEAAAEIQQLLEQLEKSYPINTTMGKMALATEAIAQIESNSSLTARILSALKTGGTKAFEQFVNHPASIFVIGALEDWQKTRRNIIGGIPPWDDDNDDSQDDKPQPPTITVEILANEETFNATPRIIEGIPPWDEDEEI